MCWKECIKPEQEKQQRKNSYVYIVKYYYYGEIRYVYFVSKYEAKIFLNRIKTFAREFEKTKDFSGRILWI